MRNISDENMTVKKEENDQFRDNKTKNLKFRVTEEEYEYIQKKCCNRSNNSVGFICAD